MDDTTPAATKQKDEILAFWRKSRDDCSKWHENIVRWRNLYDFDHYSGQKAPKAGERRFSDPTPTNTVDLAVGILLGNRLDWKAHGWKPSATEEKDSSHIEKYLAGVLEVNTEREQCDLIYETILNFVRDGCGVVYTTWDQNLASQVRTNVKLPDLETGEKEYVAFTEPPLRVQVIDPLLMTLVPGGDRRWLWQFRTELKSVLEVETTYHVLPDKYSGLDMTAKAGTMGVLIDAWWMEYPQGVPEVWNAGLFEGEFLFRPRKMPGYDLAYTIGFFKPVGSKPEYWGHGILRPMETSISEVEFSINRRSRQINVFAGMPFVIRAAAGRKINLDPGFGEPIQLHADENIGFPEWRGSPPDVQLHLDFFRSRVQQSGFSDVMYGSGPNQIAGYALSQLGDQNRIRLEQPVTHLELMWTTWAKKALRLTSHYAEGCIVRTHGRFRGADFSAQVFGDELVGFAVKAIVKPEFPNEQARKHAMATQVKGILPDRVIMEEYLNREQPDEDREMKLAEMAQTSPLMIQYAIMGHLQELADAGDEAAKIVLEQAKQQLLQGQRGRPPEPNAPEQLTGLASPTGEEIPPGETPPGKSEGEMGQPQNLQLTTGGLE